MYIQVWYAACTENANPGIELNSTAKIWAARALLGHGWAESVAISIDDDGNITSVSEETAAASDAERVEVLLAAMPNVHSHAHQRAMAGLGERAGASDDSFWSWREVMYYYLERIQPDDLRHIAAQLYLEMLQAGYSCVGEFQYLHHDPLGKAYTNRAEMSLQCLAAARETGIGFTALPVLYRYGGFGGSEPLDGQKRFINDADSFADIVAALQQACASDANASVGIAPHSLRAIDQALLDEVIAGLDGLAAIHIHIAEQVREVEDCIAWSGQRPVEWLFDHFDVDQQWCLIHATHMSARETATMAASGCVAGLCPTTEANLGDGFFNLREFVDGNGSWAIGSDSHISIDPVEELRWLEYGLRLQSGRRNLMVSDSVRNTGRYLVDAALAGGAQACGRAIGRIAPGYRADFVVLEHAHPRLYRRHGDDLLDSWIFSGNRNLVRDVYVGGVKLIDQGRHAREDEITDNFRATLDRLAD